MKLEKGFTLLEVIAVVLVFAAMVSLAMPALLDFRQSAAEKSVARDFLSALRLARSNAIRENLEFRVVLDLESEHFWMERGNLPDGSDQWVTTRIYDPAEFGLSFATGANCTKSAGDGDSSGDDFIHFNPNGTCGSSGNASSPYVCIMSPDGEKKLRVGAPFSVTGRAVIHRWSGSEWR